MESYDISQVPEIAKAVGAAVQRKMHNGVLSAAIRLVGHIKTTVIAQTESEIVGGRMPVDRGIYRAAWQAQKTAKGADVYNTVPYAPIIEYGARAKNVRPGRKMIEALAYWVLRKGIISKARQAELKKAGGKGMFKFLPLAIEAQKVAWAIAKSMQKKGIFGEGKGLRVLERAKVKMPDFLKEEIARELAR